jgi:hypothetical protein
MKVKTRQLVAWAVLVLAVGSSGAAAQSARTLDAGGGLYLHQIGGRALLREPSGQVTELPLPPGTALHRLERLDKGWMAAGELDTTGRTDLYLLRSEEGNRSSFPVPPNVSGDPLRSGPMPLVERGRLVGLAWLSGVGVRQTAVYASQWSGLDWSQPELVSPIGPGTQIALDGAVLADGSWLLVWSGYDGNDDEVLWSRRVGDEWSVPTALHEPNDTPDITPSLVGTGRGALAAWNWFDGATYRVKLAAFEDGSWRELEFLGPAGSVRPSLTPAGDGALLLYRTVVPSAWALHELDGSGEPLRKAVVERETTLRPGLAAAGGPTPGLEWPGAPIATSRRVEAEWQPEP